MDGNLYNYAPGNMWNGYSDGFQPPPIELQNYMPGNRDHFSRDQNKNPMVPPASPYVFFNYHEDNSHHHHHHHPHEHINRNQWQFPTWPKMKVRPELAAQTLPKRPEDKSFDKDNGLRASLVHSGPSHLSIPPPGGFCSPDPPVRIMEDVHRMTSIPDLQETLTPNIPITATNTTEFHVPQPNVPRRNSTRKNPAPRKRRDRPKKEEKTLKKRTRDEEKWARNIRKKARSKGDSYISVQGKTVPARCVKPVDCSKCKFNCPSRVSEEERHKLFQEYWNLETFKEKVDYISDRVHEFAPLRPLSGRRAYSRRYMLRIDGKDERVCKEFFVTTYDISESTIVTYMSKKRKGPDAIADMRGKQTPSNKTPEATVRSIREHILSETGLQGELMRSPTDESKNVKRLYRLYQSECEMENVKPASISVYRKVYSDMHKDKSATPVELPPQNVMIQASKRKSKYDIPEHYRLGLLEESDVPASLHGSSSPEPSETHDSLPPTSDLPTTSNPITQPETASPYDLGLIPSLFQNSSQHMPADPLSDKKMAPLNIPHTVQHQQQQQPLCPQQQPLNKSVYNTTYQGDMATTSMDRGHINNILPFMWDSSRMSNNVITPDQNSGYAPDSYTNQSHFIQPSSSALSSSLFNYRISSSSSSASSITAPVPHSSTSTTELNSKPFQGAYNDTLEMQRDNKKASGSRSRKAKENKTKKEPKKRSRNEELWGRNIRKKLRFKGEAYTSVRGKLVEAKRVKKVDCSKCKFKCTSRINDEQRERLNGEYWSLETYKQKIEFLTRYVETYTPKRKMTGRRAYSRKYMFAVDGTEERVCKDFFKATLHISESTIATALEKSRKGPEAIADMRGKHKPVNKTTEETLQNIRELIIYLTGMRPHRPSNNSRLGTEYRDITRLYQVYKYDCEKKGKKVASLGIFRNVLVKEFCIKTSKAKKGDVVEDKGNSLLPPTTALSSGESWPINVPQPMVSNVKTPLLSELLPKQGTSGMSDHPDLSIPTL